MRASQKGKLMTVDLAALRQMGKALLSADLKNRSDDSLNSELRTFLRTYRPLAVDRNEKQIWHRARLCENEKPYDNMHHLIYPPKGSNSYGRASLPNTRTLYGSWNECIALSEIGARVGDSVQLIRYRTRIGPPQFCVFLGIYEHIANHGKAPQSTDGAYEHVMKEAVGNPVWLAEQTYMDTVVSDIFRTIIGKDEHYKYKLSALYASIFHKDGFAGVIYPSVQREGYNLAIDSAIFDSAYEVIFTRAVRIASLDDKGNFKFYQLGTSCEFSPNGDILYSDKILPMTWSFEEGYKEVNPQPGWRKPMSP
jgi:hypothetical protein